ncbi:DUF2071 domain-containing protein [Panacibacter ginsenosidivorans]|uniref:DUF2071 domain-containing protein n=1 Tax=Panacibacter ginsenosidivorans TaxID=1813871 RepID=A0A5B8VBB8_9BACT|nr:DUF2071 domain-containing protein [Panacibacter ginsenosidivorans]QEC68293.1 DUF2071 domain-containing protein [Panacibacter ginsenosidivorans]
MNRGIFLSAKWEYLAMFNYEVDAAVLEEHLPPYTEVDYFNGIALVSVVGFLFNNTSVMGVKWPGFVNFEEVNLRYYIKHFNGNQWKRGVGFVSEIVPSAIVAGLANRLYNEHYSTAKMKHSIDVKDDQLHVEYKWKRKNEEWNTMQVKAADRLYDIEPGSEEEFIFEHYSGYNKLNRNTTIEYTVAHPRWQVYPVKEFILSCNIEKLYGKAFIPFITDRQPHSVFLAKGSEVSVGKPLRITHSTVKKHYSFI